MLIAPINGIMASTRKTEFFNLIVPPTNEHIDESTKYFAKILLKNVGSYKYCWTNRKEMQKYTFECLATIIAFKINFVKNPLTPSETEKIDINMTQVYDVRNWTP